MKLKITTIGNSAGVILPKELLARLRLEKGDELLALETPDGIRLTTFDAQLAAEMEVAEQVMRKLLGGRPYRTMFGFSLGYDSNLGFIHELHRVSGKDATGATVPFDSAGPAGPSDLDLTLPLGGGGALGINPLEVVLRVAWRSADAPATGWAVDNDSARSRSWIIRSSTTETSRLRSDGVP